VIVCALLGLPGGIWQIAIFGKGIAFAENGKSFN
jgi:hypothetical protein